MIMNRPIYIQPASREMNLSVHYTEYATQQQRLNPQSPLEKKKRWKLVQINIKIYKTNSKCLMATAPRNEIRQSCLLFQGKTQKHW